MKVLFVCLGNICRSPTAESVFRKKAQALGLKIDFDSAGTAAYHIGQPSDSRSIQHAQNRGYEMTHLARQVGPRDFANFDLIFAMDRSNFQNLLKICPDSDGIEKIKMITEYSSKNVLSIPDPYHGSAEDFEQVLDLLEDCADQWLQQLKKSNS